MGTYIMLGKYSREGMEDISADRTRRVREAVEKVGGNVEAIFAVLGEYDLILRVQLPGTAEAMKASLELGKLTGVSFATLPALSVEEFDRLAGG
ncbi:MAG TPA: GYD domain-containing protein [Woeseiaceae bacterium]|nr:GYD domain-containing protein [Woeseiaceae bacterium]